MATVEPELASNVAGNLLAATSAGALRRERFADAAASNLIAGMNHVVEKGRQAFSVIADLTLNRIISDQTGTDDVLGERILTERSAQAQPQEQTFNDPNYRGGASAPPGTKAQ